MLLPADAQEATDRKALLLGARFLSLIQQACEQQHITRKTLAARVGTSPAYLSQIFRGDKLPNLGLLVRMADALDLEFDITLTARSHRPNHV